MVFIFIGPCPISGSDLDTPLSSIWSLFFFFFFFFWFLHSVILTNYETHDAILTCKLLWLGFFIFFCPIDNTTPSVGVYRSAWHCHDGINRKLSSTSRQHWIFENANAL